MLNFERDSSKMPRLRSIKIGALNITIHPHSPEKYIQLFRDARRLRRSVRYKANHYAMLGSVRNIERDEFASGIYGLLYRHLDFEQDEPWLNIREEKPADEDDLESITIPEHLKPGLIMTRYVFFPTKHRLFYEMKNEENKHLGPTTAQKIFNTILNQECLVKEYGEVTVVIEPSKEGLDKIFRIPKLERLSMEVCRPNADDLEEAERKLFKRLTRQNAQKEEVELIAEKGASLEPDDDTKMLARIAASNGKVYGKGKDENNNPLEESTIEHPWSDVVKFNPKIQDGLSAFLQKTKDVISTFTHRLRR